ncbi:MAG: hypothetical protein P9M03_01060 [Candidatus Theseobacter exili]|nr:hypothetical protein [Candidatus Theseobacter exili]
MAKFSDKYLKQTIEVWKPYYPEVLTFEDAREIAENTIGLYKLIMELEGHEDQAKV